MEFDAIYTAHREYSKEQFLRAVLLKLGSSPQTPIDAVKAEFGEVRESCKQVITCTAFIETNYTASIGYDRTETYWTKEKKYDSNTKQYYYEDVQKTRIVTDWQPHHGYHSGEEQGVLFNEDENSMGWYEQEQLLRNVISAIPQENFAIGGEAVVSLRALEKVKMCCEATLHSRIRFPGDRQKDKNFNDNTEIKRVVCFILPYYEVDFSYKGKTYHAGGFACGNPNITCELPPNDINIGEKAAEETKSAKTVKNIAWFGFLGLFALACVMIKFAMYWSFALPLVALVGAILLNVKYDKEYAQKIRSFTHDIAEVKLNSMKEALSAHSFAALSESELDLFDFEGEAQKNIWYHSSNVKKFGIFGSIATVILAIVCISCGVTAAKNAARSPENVDIVLTEMTKNYSSSNGYVLNFDFEVEAGKIGISSIWFDVIVKSEAGTKLGTINGTITRMELEANEKDVFELEWKDRYGSDELFISLYNSDFDDLVFEYKITQILFEDGDQRYYDND